eukprot:11583699-Alexandrium_andersonii.AAC.1
MSASVVGSEMCIRDRLYLTPRLQQRLPVGCTDDRSPLLPAVTLVPVSYTHLTLPTICSV